MTITATVKAGAEIILTTYMADSLASETRRTSQNWSAFRGGACVTMTGHNVWGGATELPASVLTPLTLALFGNE